MKLKLVEWLEEQTLRRVVDQIKMGRVNLVAFRPFSEELNTLRLEGKAVVDYRLQIGARATCDTSALGMVQGRDRVFKLLCREIYKDLIEETYLLKEWAYEGGYDDAMINKLQRLISLMHGEDVQDG